MDKPVPTILCHKFGGAEVYPYDLSVVIPAHNEAGRIELTLAETTKCVSKYVTSLQIIVVDDGSTDDTYREATIVAEMDPRIQVVRQIPNAGKGRALITGAGLAAGKFIAFMDADLDLHPRQLGRFLDTIRLTASGAVIGSKFHPESHLAYPWYRMILSIGFYLIIRVLFGLPVRDTQTGMKVFQAGVLKPLLPLLRVNGYAFDLELLALIHQNGYRIESVPIQLESQRVRGRIRLGDIWRMFSDTLSIYWRIRVLREYNSVSEQQSEEVG